MEQARGGDCLWREEMSSGLSKFKVTGHSLVPTEVFLIVEAVNEDDAFELAKQLSKKPGFNKMLHFESGDTSSAYDWQPFSSERKQ